MNDLSLEVALTGGRWTDDVVKVGSTVRRPRKPSSAFVAQLLQYLEEVDFMGAPRYLGVDELGRDVFSFIDGVVHPKWRRWTDAQVEAAARLLLTFHAATAGTALADGRETVCHRDAGPNNFVFRHGLPVALIDFDFAGPGPAIDDVAYAAWGWCISSKPGRAPVEAQAAQLRLLADAYGLASNDRVHLVQAVLARQEQNARWWMDRLDDGILTADRRRYAHEAIEWTLRERAFTTTHRSLFSSALSDTSHAASIAGRALAQRRLSA